MMSSRGGGGRFAVGDYVVSKQIGMGSFSTVWHARHRVECTEVAIKEIATARLNSKLKESLKSEIVILKKINHCNIIRLHDMIEEPGKIYIVLEYCRGGDLSMYLQKRHGRIPETTAKHFMQQLASGLQVLRENNLIHRDLKPQNLLLSTNDENSILKIADFGFARSLQPRGLAETLCGSPLYMAPEIMQLQKYDAKADLWSVGAILFQLVTGRTPFTGNNQIQLLQNIMKSTELQFPSDVNDLSADFKDLCRKLLRRNPVERLTFEEFFNHPFLSQRQPGGHSRIRRPQSEIDGSLLSQYNPVTTAEERFVEDLPFTLDDDINAPDSSPYFAGILPERSPYVVSVAAKADRKDNFDTPIASCPEVMDSLESIDKSYVIVPLDLSSTDASKLGNVPLNSSCSQQASGNLNAGSSAPVPNINAATVKIGCAGYMETQMSGPATSQGLMEITDSLEQPSTDCSRRVESLQQCASAITELVNEKIESGRHLEAFSIQLVILAIWKQALHICHTQAASAVEGSRTQENTKTRELLKGEGSPNVQQPVGTCDVLEPKDISSNIQRAFLNEVGKAEELAKLVEPGNTEVPDAMDMIFQSALDFGRKGAVDEYMGRAENAVVFYSKAVHLLVFLQVEAPSLILNPPFSLTNSDRFRLQNYINVLNNRQSVSRSQMVALLKCEDQRFS
nr:serine/threonine-protein kinase ATG1c isoform X2 [Ipomoea batatas]